MKTGTIWAFDLGKGSIGEAVRRSNHFPQKAYRLTPTEFEKDKTSENELAGFVLETLLNRCIRLADREPVCAI